MPRNAEDTSGLPGCFSLSGPFETFKLAGRQRYAIDDTIRTAEDIERLLGLGTLARISRHTADELRNEPERAAMEATGKHRVS